MKLGLYSITYAGIWYKGRPLSVEEVIQRAKKFGYEGVEIDGKRPHGFPLDWSDAERKRIRELARSEGIEIIGVAGNNNFTSPFDEDRENELLMLSEQIRLCRDLGGKIVRIFLGWKRITRVNGIATYDIPSKYAIDGAHPGPDATMLQRWNWSKECLKEGVAIAKKHGVVLALQNHHPFIMHSRNTYDDMLDMVREVGSENLKCSLDCGLLKQQDDEAVSLAVRETGSLQVISHFFAEFGRDPSGRAVQTPIRGFDWPMINYPAFVKALKGIGYRGYMSFEFCHTALSENHEVLGMERIDQEAELAREYMSDLISSK